VRYRPRRMTGPDWRLVTAAAVSPATIGVLALAGNRTLGWTASPLHWPGFDFLPALAVLTLLAPVLLRPRTALRGPLEMAHV